MRIATDFKFNLLMGLAVVLALGAALSFKRPVRDLSNPLVPLSVDGIHFQIPEDYIPHRERRLYPDQANVSDLRIEARWPGMQPFAGLADPGGPLPFYTGHRDQLSIVIHASHIDSEQERSQFLHKFSNFWLPGREAAGERFSLARFARRPGAPARAGDDELYLYPSQEQIQTVIVCAPSDDPEPMPQVPTQTGTEAGLLRSSGCEQGFFVPQLNNLYIHVSYLRHHLKDWREIQDKVTGLVQTLAGGSKNPS